MSDVSRFIQLLESPDYAEFVQPNGRDRFTIFRHDAVTFGVVDLDLGDGPELIYGTNKDAPKLWDRWGNPGVLTHYKLLALYADPEAIDHHFRKLRDDLDDDGEDDTQYDSRFSRSKFDISGRAWGYEGKTFISFWDGLSEYASLGRSEEPEKKTGQTGTVFDKGRFTSEERAIVEKMVSLFNGRPDAIYVQDNYMAEDEWLAYGATPTGAEAPDEQTVLEPEIKQQIQKLSQLLHTATPEEKAKIKYQINQLRVGREEEQPKGFGSYKAGKRAVQAGFQTPAELNAQRRQESAQLASDLIG